MKKLIMVALGLSALALAGCQTDQTYTKEQLVAVIPPRSLYVCPNPVAPDPITLTEKQVAGYMASLHAARNKCAASLNAVQTYSTEAAKRLAAPH